MFRNKILKFKVTVNTENLAAPQTTIISELALVTLMPVREWFRLVQVRPIRTRRANHTERRVERQIRRGLERSRRSAHVRKRRWQEKAFGWDERKKYIPKNVPSRNISRFHCNGVALIAPFYSP